MKKRLQTTLILFTVTAVFALSGFSVWAADTADGGAITENVYAMGGVSDLVPDDEQSKENNGDNDPEISDDNISEGEDDAGDSGLEQPVENPFYDVSQTAWYYEDVMYAYKESLITGMDPQTFSPAGKLTRAMFVTILGRMAGVDQSRYTTSSFKDVAKGQWYSPYVEWAYKNKITNGMTATQFGVNQPVTREQIAEFIARYSKSAGIKLPDASGAVKSFKDASKVSSWAKDGVELMRRSAVIRGDQNGYFNPKNGATRAEAAAICNRFDTLAESVSAVPVIRHTVKFQTNGGSELALRQIRDGRKLMMTESSHKSGYRLEGWYTDSALTSKYDFSKPVHSGFTLYAKWVKMTSLAEAERKDTVQFGTYEQDSSSSNGKEPIEWIVIRKDSDKLLLLSKYALDCMPYNTASANVTWETCSLRKWLNSDFLSSAFSKAEQAKVLSTTISNPKSYWGFDNESNYNEIGNNTGIGIGIMSSITAGGNATKDKVFLLSLDEAKDMLNGYMKSVIYEAGGTTTTGYLGMQTSATEYAMARGAKFSSSSITTERKACCMWMLRSPGYDNMNMAIVDYAGNVSQRAVDGTIYSVRPAVWVSLK